jgi:hypothetical protein
MKGTLHKTESGWQVWYHAKEDLFYGNTGVRILPLHPDAYSVNGPMKDVVTSWEGQEVEFEIVANEGEPLGRGEQPYKQYAKLVDKATRPLTEDDAWITMKEGDITVNFKPMPEFDDPKYPDYPTRAQQLREQAWDVIWKDFRANKNASYSWALLEYLKDNYNPPTKKQD